MDTTLVINPGSTSRKYALYQHGMPVFQVRFEDIDDVFVRSVFNKKVEIETREISAAEYHDALATTLSLALAAEVVSSSTDITRVGVRVVAPGSHFAQHMELDAAYEAALKDRAHAAPLHIPAICTEIEAVRATLPRARIFGVSDSAFHSTMPAHARTYALPKEDTAALDLYHFGYHGLSVASIVRTLGEMHELPTRMVVCHIGGGVSITAVKNGVSIDTSMGFSPLSGVAMGTRAGDIDPGALLYLLDAKGFSARDAYEYLYTQGGLMGLTGTSDLRLLIERAPDDETAEAAVTQFIYGIQKEIGAGIVALRGIDALVLTATAAERNPIVRALICDGLQPFGVALDAAKNDAYTGGNDTLQTDKSPVQIHIVPTDEMGEIARLATCT